MIAGLLYALVGFIEFLVGLRFIFLLIGANPNSPFVDWIYTWSGPFVAPFNNIFGQNTVTTSQGVAVQSVLEWTSLIALVVYGLVGVLLGSLLRRRA